MDIFQATEVEGGCVSILVSPENADALRSHLEARGAVAWRSAPYQRVTFVIDEGGRRIEPGTIIEVGFVGTLSDLEKLIGDWTPKVSF